MIEKMNNGTSPEREAARQRIIELVERTLPDFAQACANPRADVVLMHQDSFGADYGDQELALLGAAIKYAGTCGKDVTVVASR